MTGPIEPVSTLAGTFLAVPISRPTITSNLFTESITLPNAIRVLSRQVKNSAVDLFGGDSEQ